ncbi:hypothetical protein EX30DRAFT_354015 [Ascodesmis nigricans]|uniref:Inactive metallocarboxypeptidase ECM14 n=1 Tax=Ascodesmis nigricans TaxID=341454 RepID=A0A4S2N542_9PEZI|nr:hypothetical protein EX30DRAFT_354015 [Ascodesmis nigricans]
MRFSTLLTTGLLLQDNTVLGATINSQTTEAPQLQPQPWFDRLRSLLPFPKDSDTAPIEIPHRISRYDQHVVLRFNISGEAQTNALANAISTLYLDQWTSAKDHVDIGLSSKDIPSLLQLLPKNMHDQHSTLVKNVTEVALNTEPSARGRREMEKAALQHNLFFAEYQPLSVITSWMKFLQSMFPGFVSIESIGDTFEGRPIQALKVGSHRGDSDEPKPIIVITGASHAREWISVSTVAYMAYSLVTGYGKGMKGIDAMVDKYDWVFIPTLNVDGYVYTWESDRLWKKNRQENSLSFCKGIDLDRAYDYHFDSSPQSSSNPCSPMYPGSRPFEAPEARHFSRYLANQTSPIAAILDLHSYSQSILYPYSYSCSHRPHNLENIAELATGLAKTIRLTSGERYEVGSACDETGFVGYPGASGSGSMIDYMHGVQRVPFTYQIKLRDTGAHGFLLPKDQIVPTGEEMWAVLRYLAVWLADMDNGPTMKKDGGMEL